MTPLFAIQCAVRHAVLKFAYSYTEMKCIIATHYFVKVQNFRHSVSLDIMIFVPDRYSNRAQ